jgi:HEAT repeat protein
MYKPIPPTQVPYAELLLGNLVDLQADKSHRLQAIRALFGGLTATKARAALILGLGQVNPSVRWWCLQLMYRVGDEPCFKQIVRALDDPVPRVRAMALYALECERCNQSPAMLEAARSVLARQVKLYASVETAG